MSAWPTVSLNEIFEIARGGSPRPIDYFITEDADGINWVMISDASEGSKYIKGTKKRIRPEGVERSRKVKPGDFVLTNSMSFGKPYIMGTSGCIHDGWLVLSPRHDNVNADFFYHVLSSKVLYLEFERRAAGATVKNLNIELVRGVKVPFPPLSEQRRIAAVLDRADALRSKRRIALAHLDSLSQSLFLDVLRKAEANLSTFSIEDAMDEIIDYRGKSPTKTERGVPLVTARIVKGGTLLEPNEFIADEDYDVWMRRGLPKPGDVLFTTEAPLGEVAQLDNRKVALAQRILVLRGKSSILDNTFLMYALAGKEARDQINARATGSTVRGIRQKELRQVTLSIPPIQMQREFARQIEIVLRLRALYRKSMAKLDVLFDSLQHRAFRGEL